MSLVTAEANELRNLAERIKSTSEQTRSTFTDESRPKFDERVIEAMSGDLRRLANIVTDLDAGLTSALRLLN